MLMFIIIELRYRIIIVIDLIIMFASLNIFQVFLLTDETNKALVDFRKAVELQPNFAISQCQKLYTEYRAANSIGDHNTINKVIEGFKELTVRFPKCVETWALYAQVMSDQQEFQKADELYQLGSKLDPNNANLYVQRGLCALQSKGSQDLFFCFNFQII